MLARYRTSLAAALIVGTIGIWPTLIAPLGRMYVAFCARFLADAPINHHYPPFVVAFLTPVVGLLLVGLLVALARQLLRQRRLALAAAVHRGELEPWLSALVDALDLGGLVIVTCDQAVYAFCGGLIRPRIFLSRGIVDVLDVTELDAVLRHERHHLRKRDPLRYFAVGLLDRLAPFFPALTAMTGRMRINAELAADRAALRHASVETVASALVKVLHAGTRELPAIACAPLSPTEARVAALLGQPLTMSVAWRDVLVSLALALMTLLVIVWLGLQQLPLAPACSACPPF